MIWNRDRGICQNPDCVRPERKVAFRDATVHHVIEHTAGGSTSLKNGVLICPECHGDRGRMQRLAPRFQDYLDRVYATPGQQFLGAVAVGARGDPSIGQPTQDQDAVDNEVATPAGGLKIVIDWGALDVDRETQTFSGGAASGIIVKLLAELIGAFGKPMEQQLTELPVVRYPLSRTPATAFLNGAMGRPFGSLPVPGTDLDLCPHSGNPEKVTRLTTLFSRLVLPDGRGFPEGSVQCSIEPNPR